MFLLKLGLLCLIFAASDEAKRFKKHRDFSMQNLNTNEFANKFGRKSLLFVCYGSHDESSISYKVSGCSGIIRRQIFCCQNDNTYVSKRDCVDMMYEESEQLCDDSQKPEEPGDEEESEDSEIPGAEEEEEEDEEGDEDDEGSDDSEEEVEGSEDPEQKEAGDEEDKEEELVDPEQENEENVEDEEEELVESEQEDDQNKEDEEVDPGFPETVEDDDQDVDETEDDEHEEGLEEDVGKALLPDTLINVPKAKRTLIGDNKPVNADTRQRNRNVKVGQKQRVK